MPGPVSDSYDPEWGTAENARAIREQLREAYQQVTTVLDSQPPWPILAVVETPPDAFQPTHVAALLSAKHWRIIRFALERAQETL